MTGKFELKIELGNDAMSSFADVATVLEQMAEDFAERDDLPFGETVGDRMKDQNGNTIGYWVMGVSSNT